MTDTNTPPPEQQQQPVTRMRRFIGPLSALAALIVLVGACSAVLTVAFSADDPVATADSGNLADPATVFVQPDRDGQPFMAAVNVTDSGFEPSVLHLPAGRPVRLVLRNHGTTEHHYLVKGLVPADLRWMEVPEVDLYDFESMTPDQLAAYGLADLDSMGEAELDHVLHHLTPSFVPSKEASPAGIKPLGTEVHGWVNLGITDTLTFFPLNTGRFEVECVLHPGHTGEVVVFLPDDATVVG